MICTRMGQTGTVSDANRTLLMVDDLLRGLPMLNVFDLVVQKITFQLLTRRVSRHVAARHVTIRVQSVKPLGQSRSYAWLQSKPYSLGPDSHRHRCTHVFTQGSRHWSFNQLNVADDQWRHRCSSRRREYGF